MPSRSTDHEGMTADPTVALAGSGRALTGVDQLGDVPGDERIEATVVLRRRAELPDGVRSGRTRLDRDALAAGYGADPGDMARVSAALVAAGLEIIEQDPGSRRIGVAGPASRMVATFGTELRRVRHRGSGIEHRGRSGPLRLPAELDGVVVAVLGIDDRPQARTMLRIRRDDAGGPSFPVPQLATVYRFPEGTDGTGETVAIIELGGGYTRQDLESYFGGLQIPVPRVHSIGVDGGSNAPGEDTRVDTEVTLDIEVVGALAPGADIAVYFAPNTDRGFLDAISRATHAHPAPAAISISWGQSEDRWTGQSRTAMDEALADATALGITVCTAAGDGGSDDGQQDGRPHVDFPSSSPHALGCGGTHLVADEAGTVVSETVWNGGTSGGATGGGVSDVFPLPQYQSGAGVPTRHGGGTGRGVPDVAADADPASGYQVLVAGQPRVVGGTSAAAPLWAALIARLGQALGRPPAPGPIAYYAGTAAGQPVRGFRDITSGDNGDYRAGPGWDACTGLGVPDGAALLAVLQATTGATRPDPPLQSGG